MIRLCAKDDRHRNEIHAPEQVQRNSRDADGCEYTAFDEQGQEHLTAGLYSCGEAQDKSVENIGATDSAAERTPPKMASASWCSTSPTSKTEGAGSAPLLGSSPTVVRMIDCVSRE